MYKSRDDVNVDINMNNFSSFQGYNNIPTNEMGGITTCQMPVNENVVNKTIYHDVEHVVPMHTRVVNNHVFRHYYKPVFTCSEENTYTNVNCGNNF